MEKQNVLEYLITKCGLNEEIAKENYYKLKSHLDIFEELNQYIQNDEWPDYPIIEEGYSAEDLLNEFNLNIIEAYNLLLLLREDPEQALENIKKGLPNKEIIIEEIIQDDISKYNHIIGLEEIKQKLLDYEKFVEYNIRIQRENSFKLYHNLIFVGPMGTGKALVANEIANILYDKKKIKEKEIYKYYSYDFIDESQDITKQKTNKILQETKGNLLYIVDTNNFISNNGKISLNIIFDTIKKEDNIIIFVMDDKYINTFLQYEIFNKIYDIFNFKGYTIDELFDIFKLKLDELKIEINKEAETMLMDIIQYFSEIPRFTNCKFIDLLIRLTLIKHSKKYKSLKIITIDDIPEIEEIEKFIIGG